MAKPQPEEVIPHKPHWVAKIRKRSRSGYVKEAGGYTGWDEYQLVSGRKILSRHELLSQAVKAVEKLST